MPSSPQLSASDKALFWDRAAHKYAASPISDLPGYEKTLARVQGLLAPHLHVLELGCGTGSTALRLASGTASYLATDVSAEMIAIAQAKLLALPPAPLRFALADAETLPAKEPGYDIVLAFNLLHLMHDLDKTLQSLLRLLKPGGLLISKTACLNEMNPLIPHLALPLMRMLGKAPLVQCFDAQQLCQRMQQQGFAIEALERHGSKRRDWRVFIVARRPL